MTAVLFVVLSFTVGCPKREPVETAEPILNDEYSLYILNPGPFVASELEYTTQKEFLVLNAGDVELSCGSLPGAYITTGAVEVELAAFASETIQNTNWLPGCSRWQLDAAGINIGQRWYYYVTLLVRRDPVWSSELAPLTRSVHARELQRFTENTDMIVRQYYTLYERDIYIFTLSGPPEDVVYRERSVRRLLSSVLFNAVDAASALAEQ